MSVSAFLLAIIMTLTFASMLPGVKVSRQAEESIAAQREVVLAFDRLMSELALMDRTSVTVLDGCLSYLSHKPYRGTNAVLPLEQQQVFGFSSLYSQWQKFVVLRLRENRVYIREYPYEFGSTLARVRAEELLDVADEPGVQEKTFARDVEQFTPVTVGSSRLQIRVRSVYRGAKKPEACDVTFQVLMRGTN